VLLGGSILWAGLTKLDKAIIAEGEVALSSRAVPVQVDIEGRISALNVSEGSRVKQGHLLAVLQTGQMDIERDQTIAKKLRNEIKLARLLLEQSGEPNFTVNKEAFSDYDADQVRALVTQEQQLFVEKYKAHRDRLDVIKRQAALFENQATALEEELAGLKSLVASFQQEIDLKRPLAERGNIAKTTIIELERRLLDINRQLSETKSRQSEAYDQAQSKIAELRFISSQRNEEIALEISQARSEIEDSSFRIAQFNEMQERAQVISPVSGTVFQLITSHEGEVMSPGRTLMMIVPDDALLVARGRITPNNIDDVTTNQPVRIRLVGYSQINIPEIESVVDRISPHVVVPEQPGAMPYFELDAQFNIADFQTLTGRLPVPGEPLQILITVSEESVLSTILQPITRRWPEL